MTLTSAIDIGAIPKRHSSIGGIGQELLSAALLRWAIERANTCVLVRHRDVHYNTSNLPIVPSPTALTNGPSFPNWRFGIVFMAFEFAFEVRA